jgi:TPR repeat protein
MGKFQNVLLLIMTIINFSLFAQTSGEVELENALIAYNNGNYQTWYDESLKAANKGNAEGMLNVAYAIDPYYAERFPFPLNKDSAKAFEYYKKSGDAGSVEGAYTTGDLYRLGEGTAVNEDQAIVYYKKAYELGHPEAANTIYQMVGTENYLSYLKDCVARKNFDAAKELSIIYISGEIVDANIAEAMKYLELGDKGNHGGCQYVLGYLYRNGFKKAPDGVVSLSNENADVAKAVYYFELAAENGSTEALNNLGEMYMSGMEISEDFEKSFSNFEKSCELDSGYGCYMCGMMISSGYVVRDEEDIEFFVTKAIDLGYQPE